MLIQTKYRLYILCVCLGIIGAGIFVPVYDGKSILEYSLIAHKTTDVYRLQNVVNEAVAKSVVVYDITNQKLIATKHPEYNMSLASITKVFTSAVAYEEILKKYPKDSERVRAFLRDIQSMMMTSSNEDAEYIASYFGENQKQRLDILHMYVSPYQIFFRNVTGLDIPGVGVGAYGKTLDVALAVSTVYKRYPEIFDKTILPVSENTNHIADKLSFFVAGKTGFTNLSGGNLMIIIQKGIGHKYLILVLGSTENSRFVDVENIANALVQLNL